MPTGKGAQEIRDDVLYWQALSLTAQLPLDVQARGVVLGYMELLTQFRSPGLLFGEQECLYRQAMALAANLPLNAADRSTVLAYMRSLAERTCVGMPRPGVEPFLEPVARIG